MHVKAAMNSYMLPHGTRSSAMPRVKIAATCTATPTHVSENASRSQKPDGQRLAGLLVTTSTGGRFLPVVVAEPAAAAGPLAAGPPPPAPTSSGTATSAGSVAP